MLDLRALDLRRARSAGSSSTCPRRPSRWAARRYVVEPATPHASIELQGVPGGVYLKLRFEADVHGPCFRCLEDAAVHVSIAAAEYHEPAGGRGARAPTTVEADELDVGRWARDALVLALPARRSCAGRTAPACARAAACASSRAASTAAARRRPIRAGRSCEAGESQRYSPPAMAVPKKKTSKARRDKRRATHRDLGAGADDVPSVPQAGAPAPRVPGAAATTGAARSSRSARKLPSEGSAWRRWPSTRWAATALRPRSSPGPSRRPRGRPRRCSCGRPERARGRARPASVRRRSRSSTRRDVIGSSRRAGGRRALAARLVDGARLPAGARGCAPGAVVSAGPTGAMLAASLAPHRPHPRHPPSGDRRRRCRPWAAPCVLIDAGANPDARPEHLAQFGVMGAEFASDVLGVEHAAGGAALDRRGGVQGQPADARGARAALGGARPRLRRQLRGPRRADAASSRSSSPTGSRATCF